MPANKKGNASRYYHISSKSVRKKLFVDEDDYSVFLGYLNEYLTSPEDQEIIQKTFKIRGKEYKGVPHQPKNYHQDIELIAYSLAKDHFHLLLCEKKDGKLEKFLRSLATRYAIYFNKRYEKKGSLFHGPYKSVELTNPLELVLLSKHLHQEKGHTSFAAYDTQDVSWLHPEATLKLFAKLKDKLGQGASTYKAFVENYLYSEEDATLLETIAFETVPARYLQISTASKEHSELLVPAQASPPVKKGKTHAFKFIGLSFALYVVLFTLGLQNVHSSLAQVSTPPLQETTEVLSTKDETEVQKDHGITTDQFAEISSLDTSKVGTTSAVLGPHTQIESQILDREQLEGIVEAATGEWELVTVTADPHLYINIRKEPTLASEVIAKAQNEDVFDMVGYDDTGWYEVILEDGSHGFISSQFVTKLQ